MREDLEEALRAPVAVLAVGRDVRAVELGLRRLTGVIDERQLDAEVPLDGGGRRVILQIDEDVVVIDRRGRFRIQRLRDLVRACGAEVPPEQHDREGYEKPQDLAGACALLGLLLVGHDSKYRP